MIRILFSGSRTFNLRNAFDDFVPFYNGTTVLIHGGAKGLDTIVHEYYEQYKDLHLKGGQVGKLIEEIHLPDWKYIRGVDKRYIKTNQYGSYNSRAGIDRNEKMFNLGFDYLICFWDKESKGTKDMINRGLKRLNTEEGSLHTKPILCKVKNKQGKLVKREFIVYTFKFENNK